MHLMRQAHEFLVSSSSPSGDLDGIIASSQIRIKGRSPLNAAFLSNISIVFTPDTIVFTGQQSVGCEIWFRYGLIKYLLCPTVYKGVRSDRSVPQRELLTRSVGPPFSLPLMEV